MFAPSICPLDSVKTQNNKAQHMAGPIPPPSETCARKNCGTRPVPVMEGVEIFTPLPQPVKRRAGSGVGPDLPCRHLRYQNAPMYCASSSLMALPSTYSGSPLSPTGLPSGGGSRARTSAVNTSITFSGSGRPSRSRGARQPGRPEVWAPAHQCPRRSPAPPMPRRVGRQRAPGG